MLEFIAKDNRGNGLCMKDRVEIISTLNPTTIWIIGVRGIIEDWYYDLFGNVTLKVLTPDNELCIIYPQSVVKINYYETRSRYVTFH